MADAPSFAWDPVKDRINHRKHGVPFERAQHAFFDPRRVIAEVWTTAARSSAISASGSWTAA